MIRALAAASLCVILAAVSAHAQETIEPDRPDVTNGTHIVDIGLLQIEMGVLFTRATPGQRAFGSPFTARVGLTDWLEVRFGTDGLLTQTDGFTHVTGIGNMQVGGKLRLWADPGGAPVVSILPTVNVPTASAEKGLGSGSADYTLAMLTGADIGRHGHVDVNYGIGSIGVGDGKSHFLQHVVSVSASAAASDNWNPYVESFWFSREESDGGAVTAALDGGVQVGVSDNAPAIAAFGGVSVIVGEILGSHGARGRQRQIQRRAARRAPRSSTSK
ncbi:MAG: hypothetical protein AUJ01_07060 [Acidobacteria bacterium 13_1_40CM_3_65_5]|nr:MAG: hypothetical protein AUJ01_07060 [Acidobacteria bacterium 13_1_40CM_3_65_5]